MASTTSITHENTGDDQDFVAVTSKRSSMKNMKPARKNNKGKGKGRWEPPVEKPLSVLLQQKIDLLRGSLFLQACQDLLRNELSSEKRRKCKKCLCLGLGSLRHSPKSLLQLALLQLLLESDFDELSGKPVSIDPEFTPEDADFLKGLGHEVIDYKDDILDIKEETFLYLPHCPRWLYEKLLERNEDHLDRMILLSNDLSLYAERELRAEELKKIPKLRELGNSFQVFALPEYEDRPDAFNDMAWQWTACSMHERSQLKDIDSGDVVSTVDRLAESVATLTVDTSNGRL